MIKFVAGVGTDNLEGFVSSTDGFFPIPLQTYQINQIVDTPLYLLYDGKFLIFLNSGRPWLKEDEERLKGFGVNELYIKIENESGWLNWMAAKMPQLLNDFNVSEPEKAKIIYQTSVSAVESFFKDPKSPEAATKSVNFIRHCVQYLASNQNGFYEIFNSSTQNLIEKAHGIHCAAYAIKLAQHLGFNDKEELNSLGIGAVLHDIGKTKIKKSILEKQGPLDEDEWMEIRKHPRYGYEMTLKFQDIPELARLIIWQHHERPDGTGYPKSLKNDIHPFSNIVAIADVFDSMTSHRPYKAQSPSFDTMLELLSTQMGKLDKSMLISFIEMMKK